MHSTDSQKHCGTDNYGWPLNHPAYEKALNRVRGGWDDVQIDGEPEEVEGGLWVPVRVWVAEDPQERFDRVASLEEKRAVDVLEGVLNGAYKPDTPTVDEARAGVSIAARYEILEGTQLEALAEIDRIIVDYEYENGGA